MRVKATVSDKAVPCLLDKINGKCGTDRPNMLWVADFTYAAKRQGFVNVVSR
jgi:putative transposase